MAVAADRMTEFQHAARATRATRLAKCYRRLDVPLHALLVRHTRSIDDAEDLAQEAFLRLWRMAEWDRINSIEAFVFKTAVNLVRDRSRRTHTRMMRATVPLSDVALPDAGSEPDRIIEAMQVLGAFSVVVARLHPDTGTAFTLHKIENCPHAEVAQRMGISVSMVEKHVCRALKALRLAGIDPSSA